VRNRAKLRQAAEEVAKISIDEIIWRSDLQKQSQEAELEAIESAAREIA
jgi:hypothetical protein